MLILCDMDGVIANWVDGIIATHKWQTTHDDFRTWNHHEAFGFTEQQMWEPTFDGKWWSKLEPYPWANELVCELMELGDVIYCTSPNRDATCPSQKVQWLRHHGFMDEDGTNYQIGKRKELNAASGAILIDDSDANVQKYRDAGGIAILFPQPWNQARDVAVDRVQFVLHSLAAIVDMRKQMAGTP